MGDLYKKLKHKLQLASLFDIQPDKPAGKLGRGRIKTRNGFKLSQFWPKGREARLIDALASTSMFDPELYLAENADVAVSGMNPAAHYIRFGRREGRKFPGRFDRDSYLAMNPDVAESGMDALEHYLRFGQFEGRPIEGRRAPHIANDILRQSALGRQYFKKFGFTENGALSAKQVNAAIRNLICDEVYLTIADVRPDVSIIIPVYGQLPFLLNCLNSLAAHRSRFSVEVIVIDDVSPAADKVEALQAVPWIRYKRRVENGGFIDTCNEAASIARGKYLVFLNSDVRVGDGWLDELIGSFALFPRAGLVGSRLFNEDGTLQEAGGIYWKDGSAWNYGRGADGNHPKYSFARQVDYCSGAAIAVPVAIWREMGGFDTLFRPAYCEDADLAFRLRDAGYQVWLQPLSSVLHYEGRTHGRDVTSGIKAYQVANTKLLESRWRHVLASHRPNAELPDLEANRLGGERILVFDALTPTPDQDSGSFITVRMIRALQELGFHVIFVPQHGYRYEPHYTQDLQRIGVECLYYPYFTDASSVFADYNNVEYLLGYRYNVLQPIYDDARRMLPKARLIFHNVDLHFVREQREAELYGARSRKIAAANSKIAELSLIANVDCTIVHTAVEAQIIRENMPVSNIVEFPYIADPVPTDVPFEQRRDIMFLGGFAHTPNVDAVHYFMEFIWQQLSDRLPADARLLIVGASPPGSIRALANERVVVTGYVEEIKGYFDQARVFVAPLRYGAGIKGKVIQSLAHGVPSVLTPIAAEGIGLESGVHAVIAGDAKDFIEAVLTLYDSATTWNALQQNGYDFVEKNYSWDRCLDLCRTVLDVADKTWIARQETTYLAPLIEKVKTDAQKAQ
ncbi:glycosyltransferase [Ancylobacter radicis]|uniref:Glycosyltransferase n=1 Tax=Ancylobacter radicis TaxID=2836179 RepID=A0ABS5RBW8_9HYPH|nr:glycosyltransferase [Ancylobacter radicis]MBS9478334.1 glycosyltransferase [Ancylobacter radicis]